MLVKDKDDTPQSIIESLRHNFEKDETRKILPIKSLANSQPTPPVYPQAELDQAFSVSLREAAREESILTSLYRSFIDDQKRLKEAEQIKLRKQREILERYEAKKETYRQQLILIEQARKQYLELEAGLSKRIEEKVTDYLTALRSITDQITPKTDRILRAYLLGLINAEKVVLDRSDEDEYARLRNHIKSQDGHACIICHKTSAVSELHVHHIIPLSMFGTNEPQNLVTLCYSCHNKQHKDFKVDRLKPIRRPRKNTFIAISIKTTGFYSEDEIIEIGAALFENGKVIDKFQSLLHTKRPIYDKFSKLTGITQEILDDAPKPDTVFPQFLSFIGTSKLVVHNESFVMRFLQKNAQYCGTTISNNITDSLSLARKKLPQLDSKKLYILANHFNINKPFSSNALDDSIATGFVYLSLAKLKKSKKTSKGTKSTRKASDDLVATTNHPEKPKKIINELPLITGKESLEDAYNAYCKKDYVTAFKIYRRLAKQGIPIAQFNLGVMYKNGQGIAQHDEHAVYCYQKAAEQGYALAQNNLGWMYENGRGIEQNYEYAVFWYRKAAEQDHDKAQYNLGEMYEHGHGVKQDYEQAVFWYLKAAEQDHDGAQFSLGWMYANGHGIEQDDEEAVFWYWEAAKQGCAKAQNNLGIMYERGRGIEKDDEQAVYWYHEAAYQGHAIAQCNLGWMYENGRGVEKNDEEAVFWYLRSAEQGYDRAQTNLKRLGIDWKCA